AKLVAYPDQDRAYADLQVGRLDAALQDLVQAELGFLRSPQGAAFEAGKAIESDLMPGTSAIGILKGNQALKALLDKGLAQLHADGTYARLQKQYFGDLVLYSNK
ncbi:MAG: transporter substrate-binding domain-containing protein, partial [Pseudomonas sp.]|nr:transporter substrate-binding domain-containing protein [Pseudomonas sp.]